MNTDKYCFSNELIETLKKNKQYVHEENREVCSFFENHLLNSAKFILTIDSEIRVFGEDIPEIEQKHLDMLRLPYKAITIESYIQCEDSGQPLKLITMAFELSPEDKDSVFYCGDYVIGEGGIMVWPALFIPGQGWDLSVSGDYIRYGQEIIIEKIKDIVPDCLDRFKDKNINTYKTKPVFLPSAAGMLSLTSSKKVRDEHYTRTHRSNKAIFTLCSLLNCKNIGTELWTPEESLNRKRIKKGRLPFFEYKMLYVKPDKNDTNTTGVKNTDRLSPRQHLRRGHIRVLRSGDCVWVSACVVGDKNKGFVKKDYIV